ncbi:MAG: tyrosine-type recombinase/integrase [Fluviicola sp.]
MARRVTINRRDKFISQEKVLSLLQQFINDSVSGRRTKSNGTRIGKGTITNYEYFNSNMIGFLNSKTKEFRIYNSSRLNHRETERAKKHYQDFYRAFTAYLYDDKNCFDNYVGLNIKCLRSFFNYLANELNYPVGTFHKSFYVPVELIPIVVLTPEQLRYFISDPEMNRIAKENNLEVIKDIFVFGCAVALRISDLMHLDKSNLIRKDGNYYINVKSIKTKTFTSIKLPEYCIEILEKYAGKHKTLLPQFSKGYFNLKLKELASLIPDNYVMVKKRERRGKEVVVYKDKDRKEHYRLSDHITAHTMRRTAITTMLNFGMQEHMVRKISGHSPNSKEFFRYVELSQSYLDSETDRVFNKIVG